MMYLQTQTYITREIYSWLSCIQAPHPQIPSNVVPPNQIGGRPFTPNFVP